MSRRRRKPLPVDPVEVVIESMSHDGRGVAHIDGKVVFVRGALPGEKVRFIYTSKRRKQDEGRCVEVLEASADRVEPACAAFGICGGCSLQHQAPDKQILSKQGTLKDNLQRIGGLDPASWPEAWLPPLTGPHWGYRTKARLGVRYVRKKDELLVGFREAGSSKVSVVDRCPIMHPDVGERIGELKALIGGMQARETIPQIEVAIGESHTSLIFRHLEDLCASDRQALADFAASSGIEVLLQSGGPDTIVPLDGDAARKRQLFYTLADFDTRIEFESSDFTQVNVELNQKMLARAVELLDLDDSDLVLDLFCGLGNFTLPIARKAGQVVGVEGDEGLVQRARENARRNGIGNVEFHAANLFDDQSDADWLRPAFNKVLLDPPRSGAIEMMPLIGAKSPSRIVYVACHPGTLARDAGVLVNEFGYRLVKAGVMDMFPHTAHVESIALFEKVL